MPAWSKWMKVAFSVKPKGYKLGGHQTYSFNYKPKKEPFKVTIHVITNDYTFS